MTWKEVKEKYPNIVSKSIMSYRFTEEQNLDNPIFPLSDIKRVELSIEFDNHGVLVDVMESLYRLENKYSYHICVTDFNSPIDIDNEWGRIKGNKDDAERWAWIKAFEILESKLK